MVVDIRGWGGVVARGMGRVETRIHFGVYVYGHGLFWCLDGRCLRGVLVL